MDNYEPLYWALTSILGGQEYSGRLLEIPAEWSLNTRDKVVASKPLLGYTLLTSTEYGLPTTLPDGEYSVPATPGTPGVNARFWDGESSGKRGCWLPL